MKTTIILLSSALVAGFVFAANWKVDASKAKVQFSVKGPLGTVHGTFGGLKAEIDFNEKNPSGSSITASIDPNTVSSGVGLRNHHLKTEEQWLDTKKYPRISYRSKHVEKTKDGYVAHGELTLKDVTRPVELPFTFSGSGNGGVFKGHFTIKRSEFHLGKPGGSVGEEITISLEVPATR